VGMPAPVPGSAPHAGPGARGAAVLGRARGVAPEAFGSDRLLHLMEGSGVGCFGGGERLHGNFPTHSRYPASI